DGTERASTTLSGLSSYLINTNNNALFFGSQGSGTNGSYYLDGSLDEVRLYNQSLGASSIATLAGQTGLSVTGLTVNSRNSTNYSVQNYALAVGANQYGDTTDTFTTVPSKYLGATLIRTANADHATTGSNLLSFTVNQPVTVYILYDDASGTQPAWLSDFT